MIPILYEKTETAFTSNGLGRLSDCIRCIVTEGRNEIYEAEFDYPVTGAHFEDIQIGRIISCTHDEQGDMQPFDIYAKSEPINGVVTFRAHHISYRLNEITVKPFTAGSCAEALAKIDSQSVTTNPFTFWTNKSISATFMSETPRKARAMLGGEENSILDIYGTGEYEFDKFDVKLHLHRGQDTNVSIRYGKNLVDFNNDEDTSDVYTAIVPYWLGSETVGDESVTVLVRLPEWFLTSGHTVPSGREVIVPMDLSGEFSEKPSVSDLRTRAQSRLASSDGWLPNQTVTINFVQLWQTEEYKDYAPLQRLKLCDTCGVFVPMYNMSLRAKVIKVVYNVLLDRYDSMDLGDKPTTYAAVIEKQFDSKVAGIEQGFQAIKIDIETVEQVAAADATQKANAAEQAAISAASTDATQKANAAQSAAEATASADATAKANAAQSAAISAAATDATQKANAAQSAAEATASADATAKANAAQSAAEATASADATAKANAAQSAAEATASADATAKANAAEANAKSYADSEILALRTDLEGQIDAKIETWAQSSNPATSWTTAEIRAEHNGDLWLYTGTSSITVGSVTIKPQGVYQYNGSTGVWAAYSSTTNNLFDLVDGKTTIFYGSPTGTYSNKQTGDYLVDSSTGITYRWSGSAWVKQTDYKAYTDGAITTAKQTIESEYEQAIEDATELIRGGTGGYIVTTVNANGQPIELLITDNLNLNQAVNIWRWNLGGLAHSSNGYNGPFTDVAITQDGKINASMIMTGILNANLIKAGTISDDSGLNYWNLVSGFLQTKQGQLGPFAVNSDSLVFETPNQRANITIYSYQAGGFTLPAIRIFSHFNPSDPSEAMDITTSGIYFYKGSGSNIDESVFYGLGTSLYSYGTNPAVGPYVLGFNIGSDYMSNLLGFYPERQYTDEYAIFNTPLKANAGFRVTAGTKSKVVKTVNYSDRALYCYETPTPLFGDIGEAVLDEEGLCYVDIDDIFSETIAEQVEYQVFLQKEGEGDCWIAGKGPRYFIIQGTPHLKVAWELKAKQRDFETYRLEIDNIDVGQYARVMEDKTFENYINEQEALLYG